MGSCIVQRVSFVGYTGGEGGSPSFVEPTKLILEYAVPPHYNSQKVFVPILSQKIKNHPIIPLSQLRTPNFPEGPAPSNLLFPPLEIFFSVYRPLSWSTCRIGDFFRRHREQPQGFDYLSDCPTFPPDLLFLLSYP